MADERDKPSLTPQLIEKAEGERPPVNPWMDPASFPDGGTKAWFCVAGAAACFFCSFGKSLVWQKH